MRITILGATGGVGRQLLEQAMAAGHDVTAVVRRPEQLPATVRSVYVDFSAPDQTAMSTVLKETVVGADAVLSALGPGSSGAGQLMSQATGLVIAAMQATDTRRLLVISPAHSPRNAASAERLDHRLLRRVVNPVAQRTLGPRLRDFSQMAKIVRESGLVWTIVQPDRLVNRPLSGSYRTSMSGSVLRRRAISRANLAHFMLQSMNQSETIGQSVRITD